MIVYILLIFNIYLEYRFLKYFLLRKIVFYDEMILGNVLYFIFILDINIIYLKFEKFCSLILINLVLKNLFYY